MNLEMHTRLREAIILVDGERKHSYYTEDDDIVAVTKKASESDEPMTDDELADWLEEQAAQLRE